MKKIDVVAAVIINDGQVLCAQRGYSELKDKWEFPGWVSPSDLLQLDWQ